MITKGYDISFKDVDTKQGIVSGYFASFGTKDSDGDIIEPGAFRKTMLERGPKGKQLIKWLLDHDRTKVPGKLLELEEDHFGAGYVGKVGRHSVGRDFLLMVEDGLINQHSFGFKVIKEQYNHDTKTNHIKELMMFEGSSIQFLEANPNTPITGLKSLEDALEMCAKIQKFIRTSTATDDTLAKLEKQLKSLLQEIEPLQSTQHDVKKPTIDELEEKLLPLFNF